MRQSSLFSDYMVSESVNRSIRSVNHSPTSGIVHKQRTSYGPRLTLLNKSTDQSMAKEDQKKESQQYIEKILLLSLEISRLNNLNETLRNNAMEEMNSSKVNISKEVTILKESNQTLKIAIKTLQSSLMKVQEQKSRMKASLQSKISELQLQISNHTWKTQQIQKQLQKARRQNHSLQVELERVNAQKTRQELNQSRLINKEMQKSIQAEKNYQITLLKENISKLQGQVNQLRFNLKFMQEDNQRLARRQTELLMANQEYANEFQEIKKRIDYDLVTTGVNTSLSGDDIQKYQVISSKYDSVSRQYSSLLHGISQLQHQLRQKQQELRQNHNIIQQLRQNSMQIREKYQKLSKQFNQREFWQRKKLTSLEEQNKMKMNQLNVEIEALKQSVEKVILENDLLKKVIAEQRDTIQLRTIQHSAKNLELNDKLRNTERKLKTAQRLSIRKDAQNIYLLNNNNTGINTIASPNTKLFKSRSIQSTSFFSSHRAIDINLQNIVKTTVALQGSNERSLRLITKSQEKLMNSCISPVKHKRKMFVVKNGQKSLGSSAISDSEGEKRTKHMFRRSGKNHYDEENNNMKSSIQDYYGDTNS